MFSHQLGKGSPRAGTQLGDHLAGTEGSQLAAALQGLPPAESVEETGGIEITGPGGVNQWAEHIGIDPMDFAATQHHGTKRPAGEHGN